jgi:hypothetical protein
MYVFIAILLYVVHHSSMLILNTSQKVARLSSSSAVAAQSEFLNRALHIATDKGIPPAQLVHAGAMQYLHSIRRKVDAHDFLVVDVILQDAALARIADMLLTSTVWFDATNGAAVAAHHDDGLAFKTVHTLVQVRDKPRGFLRVPFRF